MSKVLVTKSKLDSLAYAIATKSGEPLPLTLEEMEAAVEGIETGYDFPVFTVVFSDSGDVSDISCSMTYAECDACWANSDYRAVIILRFPDPGPPDMINGAYSYEKDAQTSAIKYATDSSGDPVADYIITYNSNGDIAFDESGVETRTSSDLVVSGASVTAPTGYYPADASASVASGSVTSPASISGTGASVSAGTNTLTFSKTISVTPVVSTAGYVSSGTAGNATVSLTASVNTRSSTDLSASGDTVTVPAGYYASQATKAVSSGTAGTPTASKGTVSNHSVSVTPSVTNTSGYITGSTKTGTAVSVSASELVSGSETKSANGTYDVTNLASLVVAVPIVTYYTGSSAPSSSLGSNGDIYLKTT